ncbi:phosphotransferase family protein [Actinoplanes rectilineatus]|uniref:phosphotransferase family protein n=1 Tax=Actinoplanes rectilineatus TaxID=113571 RepID=UPI0005F2EE79|nr:aminoglycoside phosphotransferase family protein [Actinoplanes rectilineatus]
MESITKNRQSPATLRAMVTRAYGPGLAPATDQGWWSELGHGWFNVAYRLDLTDGRRVVLKIAPPAGVEVLSHERGAMRTELAALELIRERTTVPVPPVDFADLSHELCDADWFVMPFIEADNLSLLERTPAETQAYDEAIGAVNRELNGIRGGWFGDLAGPGEPTWRACFTRKLAELLADGERRDVDLGLPYARVRALTAARFDSLDEVSEPRFVETDLWSGNVLVADGKIVCVIDHERAFYGDPLIEHGLVGVDLPAEFGDPAAYMRGYGQPPLTAVQRDRRWLYSVYLLVAMVVETRYRGHTTTDQYDWARSQLRALF